MYNKIKNIAKNLNILSNDNDKYFEVSIDLANGNFGTILINFDFSLNKFTVELSVSEEAYCNIYMITEDDIDEDIQEDIENWNFTKTYNSLEKTIEEIDDILYVVDSETGGSLYDEYEFTLKIKELLQKN